MEKDIDAFRKRVEILPTLREDGEQGELEEELDNLEAKVKDINRECVKQMDRLSQMVKHKKVFDELHTRLSQAYPALAEQLVALVGEDFDMDPHKGDLEELRQVKADIISHERRLKGLYRFCFSLDIFLMILTGSFLILFYVNELGTFVVRTQAL